MAGNAHARRQRAKQSISHRADCMYCKIRPKFGDYSNSTGHRRNLSRNKRQRKRNVKNLLEKLSN